MPVSEQFEWVPIVPQPLNPGEAALGVLRRLPNVPMREAIRVSVPL
jgi:hypothetical protein